MLEEKLKDRMKMENDIIERLRPSMLEAMQEQTEKIYKTFMSINSRSRSNSSRKRDQDDDDKLSDDSDVNM